MRDALLQSKAIFCMGSVYLVRNETKIEQFSITSTPLPCYYQLDRRHTHDTTSVVTSKMCFIPRLFKCLITIILSVVVSTFIVFFFCVLLRFSFIIIFELNWFLQIFFCLIIIINDDNSVRLHPYSIQKFNNNNNRLYII